MHSDTRSQYIVVPFAPCGEVLKLSVAFRAKTKKEQGGTEEISKIDDCEKEQYELLSTLRIGSHHSNSSHDFMEAYGQLEPHRRMWECMLMVSNFLNVYSKLATLQSELLTRNHFISQKHGHGSRNRITCCGGALFPFLSIFQISFMEGKLAQYKKIKSSTPTDLLQCYSVHIAAETYGGKLRNAVPMVIQNDLIPLDSSLPKLLLDKAFMANQTAISWICNFSTMCAIGFEMSNEKTNQLTLGYGYTYQAHSLGDNDGVKYYPVTIVPGLTSSSSVENVSFETEDVEEDTTTPVTTNVVPTDGEEVSFLPLLKQ